MVVEVALLVYCPFYELCLKNIKCKRSAWFEIVLCNKKLDESDNGVSVMRQFMWLEIQRI
jgi:hypothetical protein